jgi:hypothetical protein
VSSSDSLFAVIVVCITAYNMWSLWLKHQSKAPAARALKSKELSDG